MDHYIRALWWSGFGGGMISGALIVARQKIPLSIVVAIGVILLVGGFCYLYVARKKLREKQH